jgi:arsenite methyltransferase
MNPVPVNNSEQKQKIQNAIRNRYSQAALSPTPSPSSGCGCGSPSSNEGSCCSGSNTLAETGDGTGDSCDQTSNPSLLMGYTPLELKNLPAGADLGLGCGNPQAIASITTGETVLDLGSGAGIDCFLAAKQVGLTGKVIGVDMTPEMVARAKTNAQTGGFDQVEFRLGTIEELPVDDSTIDVIISNCVVNLSADKPAVYQEAFRVLKPGGRIAIADVVARAHIPDHYRANLQLISGCFAGASTIEEIQTILDQAGFIAISITAKDDSHIYMRDWVEGMDISQLAQSAYIRAQKPETT